MNDALYPEYPDGNICLQTTNQTSSGEVFPYRFVFESAPGKLQFPRCTDDYTMHLVTEGTGTFTTGGKTAELKTGDLFFTSAANRWSLSNIRGLKYLYISFIGYGAQAILAENGVTENGSIYPGFESLIDPWIRSIGLCTDDNLPTLTKGLLYYTLALLPGRDDFREKEAGGIAPKIVSMIERSYGNSALSLNYVCSLYNYHPGYLSRRFREYTGISFSDYLRDYRLRMAEKLLAEQDMSITDVALAVGYANSMYFARVFKKQNGCTPSEYRNAHRTKDQGGSK